MTDNFKVIYQVKGDGRVEWRRAGDGQVSHRFVSNYLLGTRQVASCCVLGLTAAQAVAAFPTFLQHAKGWVQGGANAHTREVRHAIQSAIIKQAGAGKHGIIHERKVARVVLPAAETLPGVEIDFRASAALGDAAAKLVADTANQPNLSPSAVLEAVRIVMADPTLSQEQRDGAVQHLLAQVTGDLLARTPESIAAFALASGIDRVSKMAG